MTRLRMSVGTVTAPALAATWAADGRLTRALPPFEAWLAWPAPMPPGVGGGLTVADEVPPDEVRRMPPPTTKATPTSAIRISRIPDQILLVRGRANRSAWRWRLSHGGSSPSAEA